LRGQVLQTPNHFRVGAGFEILNKIGHARPSGPDAPGDPKRPGASARPVRSWGIYGADRLGWC
jgi:hypothetical protein